jgi:hypothetical protein
MAEVATQRIVNWFKDHRATLHESVELAGWKIECLRWQKPGSSDYRVDYMLRNGTLCVTGDLGEAIYEWYSPVDGLKWIAGLDIGYFHSKCLASEYGRGSKNYEWDEDKARGYISRRLEEDKDYEGYERFIDADVPLHSKFELEAWCHRNDPADVFDDEDWWEWLPGCGHIIPVRTRAHLIGLKVMFGEKPSN